MKPVYLEFCGINSFSEKAQIDFTALLSGGVFGIFGDTGSGKSTILDCIHFALYGEIDRVSKSINECINVKSETAYVLFDFQLTQEGVSKTYRVRRERKRNKPSSAKANLYEKTEKNDWLALAEGTRDVDEKIEQIVGLTFADFKTCIALPQGDFAALVKSTTTERVKLVARLFNLERYGERLSKTVNEKYYKAEHEAQLISAKMDENEGADEQSIAQLEEEITQRKLQLVALQQKADKAAETHRAALELQRQKHEYDALCERLQQSQAQCNDMQNRRVQLERLTAASQVAEKYTALKKTQQEKNTALAQSAAAKDNLERAKINLEKAKSALAEGDFEKEIVRLSLDLEKVTAAQADIEAERAIKAQLDACINEYNRLKSACINEDFEEKRKRLEAQMQSLGEDDTLLDYLHRNLKGVLLSKTYQEFRTDLTALSQTYPQIQKDVDVLLKKYAVTKDGATADVASLQLAFKEIERQRKALKGEIEQLEKRFRVYQENQGKLNLLVEQGKLLRQNHLSATQKTQSVQQLGTAESLRAQLQTFKQKQAWAQGQIEQTQEKVSAYFAQWQKQEGLAALFAQKEEECKTALEQCLKSSTFATAAEAIALVEKLGDGENERKKIDAFFDGYNLLLHQYQTTDVAKFAHFDESQIAVAQAEKEEQTALLSQCLQQLGADENKHKRLCALREKYKELAQQLKKKEAEREVCDQLRTMLRGNRFLEFIASEYLQEVCLAASKTLLSLTGGRYFLTYDKDFLVGDNFDGGNLRGVRTLSGGETFLVSLSLALSLSAAICLKSLRPIEFFFLDEGFGTLDEKLVDTVMDVLGKLSKTFSVGLISHVEELKHRIDNKILVTGATERHGSKVQVESY